MKKKILLTLLIVSALVCIFAVSISAVTYTYNDADGNKLYGYDYDTSSCLISNKTGEGFAKEDANGNALTWYITNTVTDGDGNKTFTVASKKTLGEAGNINGNGAYYYADPVTANNTVSANFPDNSGILSFGFGTYAGNLNRSKATILFCYCPNTLTSLPYNLFQESNIIVAELDFDTPVTAIPQNFAHGAFNLESINIPATVKSINGNSSQNGTPFYNCKSMKSVNFPANSQLETILNGTFAGCESLVSIELPKTLTSMGSSTFSYCKSLKEVKIPASVTKYGQRTFEHCYNLEKVWMGPNVVTMSDGQSMFWEARGVKYIYLSNSILENTESITGTHVFHGTGTKGVIFFTGTYDELTELKSLFKDAGNNQQRLMHDNVLKWDSSISDEQYVQKAIDEGKYYVVYNYNKCTAFYDDKHNVQTQEGNQCSGICANCGVTKLLENPIHKNIWVLNGGEDVSYMSEFTAICKCEHCETVASSETIAAIITTKGYSNKETGDSGIHQEFKVDKKALGRYAEILEVETTTFGILAGVAGEEDGNPIVADENGKLSVVGNSTIAQFGIDSEYSIIKIKLSGINTNASIYCGAYIALGQSITYISDVTESNKASKYEFVAA